jgi:hypothetical protein
MPIIESAALNKDGMLYEDDAEMVEYVIQASSTLLALRTPRS